MTDPVSVIAWALDPHVFDTLQVAEADYPAAQKRIDARRKVALEKARAVLSALELKNLWLFSVETNGVTATFRQVWPLMGKVDD